MSKQQAAATATSDAPAPEEANAGGGKRMLVTDAIATAELFLMLRLVLGARTLRDLR